MEEENDNDIEEEMDKIEGELKEEKVTETTSQNKVGKGIAKDMPTERYTAFYIEAKMGILDTITNEIVVEGLTDFSNATLEAFKLNKLDKIGTASGV